MNFNLHIQNIGKLTDAKIRIGRFTVFAGPNNTGKSFVSKLLYSLLNAMNADHAEIAFRSLTAPLEKFTRDAWAIDQMVKRSSDKSLSDVGTNIEKMQAYIHEMREDASSCSNENQKYDGELDAIESLYPSIIQKAEDMKILHSKINATLGNEEKKSRMVERIRGIYSPELGHYIDELPDQMRNISIESFISTGMEDAIRRSLILNFQIPNLSELSNTENMSSKIDIKCVCSFQFSNGNSKFHMDRAPLRKLQQFPSVIYVESPTYWKLRNALEDIRIRPMSMSRKRERLSGVPGYFYDLASALRSEYTGDMAFQDVYERLTGKDVLGGKIVISETGAFLFQENGRSFSMPVTAMGVANLGILALLIERKVLDQETFLFIDEPEAHLHPAWQVVMAKALFDLAKGGANIVIATHSVDILKWLEVHIKRHPEDEKLVALNKFPVNGNETDDRDFDYKMAAIKGELTEPFADLYTAGL